MKAEGYIDLPHLKTDHGYLEDWIAGLTAARNELRTLIADLPAAALTWQPILTAQSIGTLLLHIASTEKYWLTEFVNEEEKNYLWNDAANQSTPTAPHQSLDWFLDRIESVRAQALSALQEFPSLNHLCTRRDETGETASYTLRWIVWHLLEHEAEHRGQIALLKRWYQEAHAPVYA